MLTTPQNMSCIVCGRSATLSSTIGSNVRGDDSNRFQVARCAHCNHAQLHPLPTEAEEAENYADHVHPKALWQNDDYYEVIKKRVKFDGDRRLKWLAKVMPDKSSGQVLDTESGYGFFVDDLCRAGYDAFGIEASEGRITLARSRTKGGYHLSALDDNFVKTNREKFQVVCNLHVLEHLRNPVETVSRLLELVAPGGSLLVEVPNTDDELMSQIPEYAHLQWQVCHFSYFDKSHLERVIEMAGATECVVTGVQRFGLRHLIQWVSERAPQMQGYSNEENIPLFERIEALYKSDRENSGNCDTLIATIKKP